MANRKRHEGEEEPDSVSSAPESGQPAGGRVPSPTSEGQDDEVDGGRDEDSTDGDTGSPRRTLAEEKDDD